MTTDEIQRFKATHNGQSPCATVWATQPNPSATSTHLCNLANEHDGQCVCKCGERFTMPQEWKDNRRRSNSDPFGDSLGTIVRTAEGASE